MSKFFRVFASGLMVLVMLALAVPALAQFGEAKGGLFGRAVDEQGGSLPGVAVTLAGQGAPQNQTTDARGEFRFLNLSPGTYTVTLALAGFSTVNRENVVVSLGRSTELTETLKLSSVAATVTVTEEAPLLDTRKVQSGAVISQAELTSIPTGRDPWVLLQSVPGVTLDRVNVAGSESGQQSTFASKGAVAGSFTLDGINQTDMSALGASALYYDFDTFQEVQVITGGSDPTIQGAGAHINMITKRGTNEVHGSARINYVSDSFENENFDPTAGRRKIVSVQEYGVEAGGPLWKDNLWLWGAYGRNQIDIAVGAKTPPTSSKTTLENLNGKLNWQALSSNALTIVGQHSNKLVFGRGAGANRPQAATTDQTLPQSTWKVEDSQVATSNLFFSAMYAGQDGFFGLDPEGKGQLFYDGNTGFLGTSPYFLASKRPQRQVKGDISYFLTTGNLGHELKAGFQYLKASEFAQTGSPSNPPANPGDAQKVGAFINTYGEDAAGIFRDRNAAIGTKYYAAFFGDTITMDRLTINAGVRWDRQFGQSFPSVAAGNPSFPDVLPAVVFPGREKDFTWNDWSPRAGITYAFGTNRNTVFKASYARFVDSVGTGLVGLTNPLGSSAGAYYPWNDANGDGIVQVGEVCTTCDLLANYGYNLTNPGDPGVSANAFDPNLKAGKTDEFLVGVDHEIMPGLAAGISYTYRTYKGQTYGLPYDAATGTIVTSADYVQYGTLTPGSSLCDVTIDSGVCPSLPGGGSYSVPVYQLNPALAAELGGVPGGFFYTNQTNYKQIYSGIDLTLTKRLSNRWMARANFTYNINKQKVGANGCSGDPNNGTYYAAPYGFTGFGPGGQNSGTCNDNDYVSTQSAGSGSHYSVFLNSKYVFNVNAMYQLPLNFNFAASLFGRQGYPINFYASTTGPDDGKQRAIVLTNPNDLRYPTLVELDLRLEKVIPITSTAAITVSADAFNMTNKATVLQEQNRIG
ncbi:MAG: TonB-dependent receptor, partial [Acidobacteriota bacterium]